MKKNIVIKRTIKYPRYTCRHCGHRVIPLTNPCTCPYCGHVSFLK